MTAQAWAEALNALGIKATVDGDDQVNLTDAPDYHLQIDPQGSAYLVCTEDGEGEHYYVEIDDDGNDRADDAAVMAAAIHDTIGI